MLPDNGNRTLRDFNRSSDFIQRWSFPRKCICLTSSTRAPEGLYWGSTCHFSGWKGTHLWKAFLGKYQTKYVFEYFYYMALHLFIMPLLLSYHCLHFVCTKLSANWGLEALIIFVWLRRLSRRKQVLKYVCSIVKKYQPTFIKIFWGWLVCHMENFF